MASACVNKIGMSPDNFIDCPPTAAAVASKYSSFKWLSSPRISFSRELSDEELTPPPPSKQSLPIYASTGVIAKEQKPEKKNNNAANSDSKKEISDPGSPGNDFVDFEFRLDDPVNMLPADELFSDGKLVPMQLSSAIRHSTSSSDTWAATLDVPSPKIRIREEISTTDPYLFSPKAPRCSSRWKEMLGLRKLYQNSNKQPQQQQEAHKTPSSTHRSSFKHLLQRSSKSSSLLSSSLDSSLSLSLPLLRDGGDSESVSISSSRLSLSSSSSGHEHEDIPKLSLDSDRAASASPSRASHHSPGGGGTNVNLHRLRVAKSRALSAENGAQMRMARSPIRKPVPEPSIQGVSVDSPRMNSSGKIVFHGLERSSSSPSSFNGGPRYKYRGMERSYSANVVRVTPVLNVPVCSSRRSSSKSGGGVFGFPLFSSSSSQPKKENGGVGGGVKGRSDRN